MDWQANTSGVWTMHIGVSVGRSRLPSQVEALDTYLALVAEHGLDVVELDFSIEGHYPEFAPLPSVKYGGPVWAEVRRRLDAFALGGAHMPYAGLNPLSTDSHAANDARALHLDAIERAGELGLLYVVVHMLGYREGTDRSTWLPLWMDYLGELSLSARRAGVILCVENTSYGFFLKDLVEIVAGVDSPWLRITLDAGHALIPGSRTARLAGSPYEGYASMDAFVRAEWERIFSLHIHDNDGRQDQHLAIGDGIGDFGYLAALRASGFAGPWVLEHYIDGWDSIGMAVERLRRLTDIDNAA